jgi:hypothetical protein
LINRFALFFCEYSSRPVATTVLRTSKHVAESPLKKCRSTHGTSSSLSPASVVLASIGVERSATDGAAALAGIGWTSLTHYTFVCRKDATLREMANLVKEVNATARNSRARISFALVFPDHR